MPPTWCDAQPSNQTSYPAGQKGAWEWRRRIQDVDERTWSLFRAVFEAGIEAGRRR